MVHGAIVATSAQPVLPAAPGQILANTLGTTKGTAPLGSWSAATSPSHFAKKPETSMLNAAVGANTCASPVQPRRSSRCGQSVGTSTKLPRCPHTMFCCSLFTSALLDSNVPVGVMSEYATMPVSDVESGVPGYPSTAT